MFRAEGAPILDLAPPPGDDAAPLQRDLLDTLARIQRRHHAGAAATTRARRPHRQLRAGLQDASARAPEAVDLSQETAATRRTLRPRRRTTRATSARSACWPAGWSSAACGSSRSTPAAPTTTTTGTPTATSWRTTTRTAGDTDKPIAGLIEDLKQRGLLDETLVVWGGEFGRQPTAEYAKGTGRDHNAYGFTMWLAGGGIKGGVSVGATDELGSAAVEEPFHVKHLHATVLHQMGLDPNRLSYFYGGLDQKLVGVEGAEPIGEIIS